LAHLNLAPNDQIWTFRGPKGAKSIKINGPASFQQRPRIPQGARRRGHRGVAGYCVSRDLADGALVRLLPEFKLPARPILVVRPRWMYMTGKIQLLVDFLREWFKKGDPLGRGSEHGPEFQDPAAESLTGHI
jgi:hypothetical protein